MPKEMLAAIAELSDAVSAVQPTEKQLVLEPEIPSDIPEPTPVDELTLSERAMIEAQNAELNPKPPAENTAGHAFRSGKVCSKAHPKRRSASGRRGVRSCTAVRRMGRFARAGS